MEPRALVQLFNISGAARTPVIAEGLPAIAEHVAVLTADAALLRESGRHRSAKVIELLADEQAGLAMMLFDIVRAEKIANDRLAALQRRFYDHRARAIYVAAYEARLDDLVEAQRHVDSYRDRRYLDGPNDVDWIMYNELDHHRESSLYVDLVADSENRFELRWQSPRHSVYAETTSMSQRPSRAVTLLLALDAIGVTSLAGVEATKAAWTSWWEAARPRGASARDPLERCPRDQLRDRHSVSGHLQCLSVIGRPAGTVSPGKNVRNMYTSISGSTSTRRMTLRLECL